MFCAKCGNELPANARFCGKCGSKVELPDGALTAKSAESENSRRQPEQKVEPVAVEKAVQQPIPSYQQPNVQRKAKPLSALAKVLILEAVVFVICAVICYTKMKEYASPETVAKSYFTAVMSGDIKKAYSMIDVEESEFVNEKYFGLLLKKIGQKNVYNFKVDESENDGEDLKKKVKITYRLKEDTSDYSFDVELEKSSSKILFLFDDWNVNIGDYIKKDVSLYVNRGSKVKLDGVDLNKKYLSEEKEDNSRYEQYVIPKMFCGTYDALVTNDIYADCRISLTVDMDEDESFYAGEDEEIAVGLKKEIIEKVAGQSQKDFRALWDSAVQQKSFGAVKNIPMPEDNSEVQEDYEELVGKFVKQDGAGLQKMNFEKFEVTAKSNDDSDMEYPSIEVSFSAPFSCVSLNRNWWSGALDNTNSSGNYSGDMTYTYQNGKWLLSDLSVADFYY